MVQNAGNRENKLNSPAVGGYSGSTPMVEVSSGAITPRSQERKGSAVGKHVRISSLVDRISMELEEWKESLQIL